MGSETLKSLIYDNIKNGASTIYIKHIGSDNFIAIKVNFFIGIEFDCLGYIYRGETFEERIYIPSDKIVHISFNKKMESTNL